MALNIKILFPREHPPITFPANYALEEPASTREDPRNKRFLHNQYQCIPRRQEESGAESTTFFNSDLARRSKILLNII